MFLEALNTQLWTVNRTAPRCPGILRCHRTVWSPRQWTCVQARPIESGQLSEGTGLQF